MDILQDLDDILKNCYVSNNQREQVIDFVSLFVNNVETIEKINYSSTSEQCCLVLKGGLWMVLGNSIMLEPLMNKIEKYKQFFPLLRDEISLRIISILVTTKDIYFFNEGMQNFINIVLKLSQHIKEDLLNMLLLSKEIGAEVGLRGNLNYTIFWGFVHNDIKIELQFDLDEEGFEFQLNRAEQLIKVLESCKMIETLMKG